MSGGVAGGPRRGGRPPLLFLALLGGGLLLAGGCGDARALPEPDPQAADFGPLPSARGERIRVEVLNAGGRRDMAREATARLRDRGFDVVYFGNDPGSLERSEVLARTGRMEWAGEVARALSIDALRDAADSTRLVDVTVRLGAEWGAPESEREEEEPEPDTLLRDEGLELEDADPEGAQGMTGADDRSGERIRPELQEQAPPESRRIFARAG